MSAFFYQLNYLCGHNLELCLDWPQSPHLRPRAGSLIACLNQVLILLHTGHRKSFNKHQQYTQCMDFWIYERLFPCKVGNFKEDVQNLIISTVSTEFNFPWFSPCCSRPKQTCDVHLNENGLQMHLPWIFLTPPWRTLNGLPSSCKLCKKNCPWRQKNAATRNDSLFALSTEVG